MIKEINHFKKKYKLEFNLISDKKLILPEYEIELLNKNKKIIKKISNIESIDSNYNLKNRIMKNSINKKFNKNFNKKRRFKKNFRNKFRPVVV